MELPHNAFGVWLLGEGILNMKINSSVHITACSNPKFFCNCDSNDHMWRSDGGFLLDRTKLPVVTMRFGDTEDDREKGFYTLGKLECSNKGRQKHCTD